MKYLTKTFLRGALTALPLALTIYAVYWIFTMAESGMQALIKPLLPPDTAVPPGLGVVAAVALLFGLGILMNVWLVRRLIAWSESVLERIPLIKTIYGGIQDMLGFFARSPGEGENSKAVMVEIGGVRLLGLLTRDECEDIPDELATKDDVAVYLPMSYQVGGFTIYVPRESVTPLDLTIEEGMRLALTAGMTRKKPEPKAKAVQATGATTAEG